MPLEPRKQPLHFDRRMTFMPTDSSNFTFMSKELSGPAQLEALHVRPAQHYTAGQEHDLEAERLRNLKAVHYPWEKSYHTRQFIGPVAEWGVLGYLFPAFRYSYYSTPDGKDTHLKCLWWVRYGGLAGFSWAVFHGAGNIKAASENKAQKMMRYGRCIATPIAAGMTYAAVSSAMVQIRGVDDVWNNGLAGMAAGGVCGAFLRNRGWGAGWAAIFGVAGMLSKYLAQHPEIKVLPNCFVGRDARLTLGYENQHHDPWFRQKVEDRPSTNAMRFS